MAYLIDNISKFKNKDVEQVVLANNLNDLFKVTHLDAYQWAIVIGASFAIIPAVEIVKFIQRRMGKV